MIRADVVVHLKKPRNPQELDSYQLASMMGHRNRRQADDNSQEYDGNSGEMSTDYPDSGEMGSAGDSMGSGGYSMGSDEGGSGGYSMGSGEGGSGGYSMGSGEDGSGV